MLVLNRKPGERIQIGDNVTITLIRTASGGARIGIDAPKSVRVVREELLDFADTSAGSSERTPELV